MRKLVAPLAGALALGAVLVGPATAQAPVTNITVDAKVTPNKAGTPKKPQAVKLTVNVKWDTAEGFEKPILQKAVARFPKGSLYNGAKFPKCSADAIDRDGLEVCPKGSIIGKASATAFADTVITRPQITIVNGGARNVCLYTILNNPARVQACVRATVKKTSGKWAYEVTFTVPPVLQIVAGVPIAVQSFSTKNLGKGDYFATTGCPKNGRWPFEVEGFYNVGDPSKYADSIPCKR